MRKGLVKEIHGIIQEFHILSEGKYSFQGRLYDISSNDEKKMNSETFAKQLVSHFALILYQKYHCRQIVSNYATLTSSHYNIRNFVESLSEGNVGHGTWEPGWIIRKIEKDGQLEVHKNGLSIWVPRERFAPTNGEIKMGNEGYVVMPKEFRSILPGFYMANGNAPLDVNPTIVRIYWNIEAEGALCLMRQVTTELNLSNSIAFQFKIINNPDHFLRADAAYITP
jgi:hypothetical protein